MNTTQIQTGSPINNNNTQQFGGQTTIFTPLFNGISYVNHHIMYLNNSKFFAGIVMILLNIGSKFITIQFSKSTEEYIDFFTNLNMGENVPLLSFVNNERMVLKQKLQYKDLEKESIQKGIKILEELIIEINNIGEKAVLEKYQK